MFNVACASRSSPPCKQSQPEDTIVLKRRFRIPTDPLVEVEKTSSVSAAHSEYTPSQESDSDRERIVDIKLWQKASQNLGKREMPIARRPTLKEIRFLDGDVQLQQFPQHLLRALENNCRAIRSKMPTCTRSIGASKITLVDGRDAFFQVKSTGERLLQARFKYASNQQITIVKERVGKTIDGGRAVIITSILGGPQSFIDSSGATFTEVRFKIWSPSILTRHSPASTTDIVRLIRIADKETSPPKIAQLSANPNACPTDLIKPSLEAKNDVGAGNPYRQLIPRHSIESKDTMTTDDAYSSDSDTPLISSALRKGAPQSSSTVSPRNTTLASPSVRQDLDQQNQQAQSNITVTGTSLATDSTYRTTGFSTPTRTVHSAESFTPSSTFGSLATQLDLDLPCPAFVFKKAENAPISRRKSAAFCNTVEKLFAQASVADVITKDWSMLRLSIIAGTVSRENKIIRGDQEDFEVFVEQAKRLGDIEIVVLPGDE